MKEITLEADIKNIPVVTDLVNEVLEEADCPIKVQMQIDVVVDELFSNISFYAYENGGEATVSAQVSGEPAVASITFKDRGKAACLRRERYFNTIISVQDYYPSFPNGNFAR